MSKSKTLTITIGKYKSATKRLKSRRLNRNAPKAKTHKPKKGKGSFIRTLTLALKNLVRL
jgi:hypothetical protein